jgi:hypothetical protein
MFQIASPAVTIIGSLSPLSLLMSRAPRAIRAPVRRQGDEAIGLIAMRDDRECCVVQEQPHRYVSGSRTGRV